MFAIMASNLDLSVKKNLPPKNPDGERAAAEGKGQGDLGKKEALTLATMEKTEEDTQHGCEERTETEKPEAKEMTA
jgi:hypothetical protein